MRFVDPVRLILVGWDPRRCQVRQYPQVREAAQFLADAEKSLRLESHSAVWLPSAEELRRYQLCRNVGDLNASREALVESIDASSYAVSAYVTPGFAPRRKPESIIEARAELERCIHGIANRPVTAERCQQAEETFAHFVEEYLVQPLHQQALENSDPMQRNLGVLVAEACRALHLQSPYLERDLLELAKGSLSPEDQQRVLKQARQRDREIAYFIRLAELKGR